MAGDATSCATCGISGGNLRRCCGQIYYCSTKCQKAHRKTHVKLCNNTTFSKRKNAVADGAFAVGVSTALAVENGYDSFADVDMKNFEIPPRDDCPLCMFPMSVDNRNSEYMACCGKELCTACSTDHAVASLERGIKAEVYSKCVFCRSTRANSDTMMVEQLHSNAKRGDGRAMFLIASSYENGLNGLPINYQKAVELYHAAVKLGSADAAHTLGSSYMAGDIVQMDKVKARRLLYRASKGGSLGSLHQLGCMEFKDGGEESLDFVQYFFMAAALGWRDSLDQMKRLRECGIVSEEDFKCVTMAHIDALRNELSESRVRVKQQDAEIARQNTV